VAEVANVVWCTGFDPDPTWIDLPLPEDEPWHRHGTVREEPGLYFVGLAFLYAASSSMLHGVGRDARRIAEVIASRAESPSRGPTRADGARTMLLPT
jgi:putative flavoprotein involved in K+ transport